MTFANHLPAAPVELLTRLGAGAAKARTVATPGVVPEATFFSPTVSGALRSVMQKMSELAGRNPAPGQGHRAAIRDAVNTAAGYLWIGAYTEDELYHAAVAACAQIWGRADDDDLRWIAQFIELGKAQPLAARPDPMGQAVGPTVAAPTSSGAAGDLLCYDSNDLDALPDPKPLLDGLLHRQTLAVLSGKFGTFKTFIALGWAAAVATGTSWGTHTVPEAVPVLYVAAEGASGIRKRLRAWRNRQLGGRGIPRGMLNITPKVVNLARPESVAALHTAVEQTGAKLVVIDTLHRCTPGLEENSNTEMGAVIGALTEVIQRHGATVLVLHHTGHEQNRSRGASAIEDDADTVFLARFKGADEARTLSNPRVLEQRKSKDDGLLEPVSLLVDREQDSLVITPENNTAAFFGSGDDRSARAAELAELLERSGADPSKSLRALSVHVRDDLGVSADNDVLRCAVYVFKSQRGHEANVPLWYSPPSTPNGLVK